MSHYAEKLVRQAMCAGTTARECPRSLVAYVESTKHIELDAWQKDLCRQLEEAFWIAQHDAFKNMFSAVPDIGASIAYYIAPSGLKIEKARLDSKRGRVRAPRFMRRHSLVSPSSSRSAIPLGYLGGIRYTAFVWLPTTRFTPHASQLSLSI